MKIASRGLKCKDNILFIK